MVYRGLYSYRQRVRVITLFPNIFWYCFCMLSDFAKVFERKVWRVQVAHLHNAAHALSKSESVFSIVNKSRQRFLSLSFFRLSLIEPARGCVAARCGSSQYPQFDLHRVSSSSVVEHPTRSRRVVGSNPIWSSDFFRVYVSPRIYVISSLILW